MKIRNGFVSNSSSSSFVVAFPKKPKSFDDVYEMMFYGKEGSIQPFTSFSEISYKKIAMRVWDDIKSTDKSKNKSDTYSDMSVPATKEQIVYQFSNRYHYSPPGNYGIWMGRSNDSSGGAWYDKIGPYCGSDKYLLSKLRDVIVERENEYRDVYKKQNEIIKQEFHYGPEPKYAYRGGHNYKTKKPYTEEEIQEYEKFSNALRKFKEENKKYVELEKERIDLYVGRQDEEEIRQKLAEADATSFINDNKDAFLIILSYSDNDGEFDSSMEHGNIFGNIPHVVISHH